MDTENKLKLQVNTNNDKYEDIISQLRILSEEKKYWQEHCTEVEQKLTQTNVNYSLLQKDNEKIKRELNEREQILNTKIQRLQDKLSEQKEQSNEMKNKYEQSEEYNKNLKELYDNLKTKYEVDRITQTSTYNELKNEYTKIYDINEKSELHLALLDKEREGISIENEQVKIKLAQAVRIQEELKRKNLQLKEMLEEYNKQYMDTNILIKDLNNKISTLDKELKQLMTQREKDIHEERRRKDEELRNQMTKTVALKEVKGKIIQFKIDRMSPKKH